MLKSTLILLCFGLIWINSSSALYIPNETMDVRNFGRCTTPNKERGLCVILTDCKYIYNILMTHTLLPADKRYLARSQCGFQNGNILICCPERYHKASPMVSKSKTTPQPLLSRNPLLPAPGECGNMLANRIYGGNVTRIDEFPWMALIEYTKPDGRKGHHCGGSLINSRYVITAAHCVNGKGLPEDWKISGVRLGEWDTTTNPDCEVDVSGEKDCAPPHLDVAVESVIPHPGYIPSSKDQLNDIALLRLTQNVKYTDFISPICLPVDANSRSANYEGIVMDVAGWGQTETISAGTVKLKAGVKGVALDDCRQVYATLGIELDDSQMCAGGRQGIDSCQGDSGGPLISLNTSNEESYHYFLAGVVSFGPTPCGLEGWPGVYTRTGHFIEWIHKKVEP